MISHFPSSPFDMFSSLKLVGWLSGLERSLWWISGKVFTGRLYINTHTFTPCISGFFWFIIVITWSSMAFSVGWFGWFCILVHIHILTLTYKHLDKEDIMSIWVGRISHHSITFIEIYK